MTQIALPVAVDAEAIARKRSLGKAIEHCIELGGFDLDKQVGRELGFDRTQVSRWQSEQEGIKWAKLVALMDACGNDAPLLWMLHDRGYDVASVRKRETELQRELREAREEIVALRRVAASAMAGGR